MKTKERTCSFCGKVADEKAGVSGPKVVICYACVDEINEYRRPAPAQAGQPQQASPPPAPVAPPQRHNTHDMEINAARPWKVEPGLLLADRNAFQGAHRGMVRVLERHLAKPGWWIVQPFEWGYEARDAAMYPRTKVLSERTLSGDLPRYRKVDNIYIEDREWVPPEREWNVVRWRFRMNEAAVERYLNRELPAALRGRDAYIYIESPHWSDRHRRMEFCIEFGDSHDPNCKAVTGIVDDAQNHVGTGVTLNAKFYDQALALIRAGALDGLNQLWRLDELYHDSSYSTPLSRCIEGVLDNWFGWNCDDDDPRPSLRRLKINPPEETKENG